MSKPPYCLPLTKDSKSTYNLPFMQLDLLCTQCLQKTQKIHRVATNPFLNTKYGNLPELLTEVSQSLSIIFASFIFIQSSLVSMPSFHFLNLSISSYILCHHHEIISEHPDLNSCTNASITIMTGYWSLMYTSIYHKQHKLLTFPNILLPDNFPCYYQIYYGVCLFLQLLYISKLKSFFVYYCIPHKK